MKSIAPLLAIVILFSSKVGGESILYQFYAVVNEYIINMYLNANDFTHFYIAAHNAIFSCKLRTNPKYLFSLPLTATFICILQSMKN